MKRPFDTEEFSLDLDNDLFQTGELFDGALHDFLPASTTKIESESINQLPAYLEKVETINDVTAIWGKSLSLLRQVTSLAIKEFSEPLSPKAIKFLDQLTDDHIFHCLKIFSRNFKYSQVLKIIFQKPNFSKILTENCQRAPKDICILFASVMIAHIPDAYDNFLKIPMLFELITRKEIQILDTSGLKLTHAVINFNDSLTLFFLAVKHLPKKKTEILFLGNVDILNFFQGEFVQDLFLDFEKWKEIFNLIINKKLTLAVDSLIIGGAKLLENNSEERLKFLFLLFEANNLKFLKKSMQSIKDNFFNGEDYCLIISKIIEYLGNNVLANTSKKIEYLETRLNKINAGDENWAKPRAYNKLKKFNKTDAAFFKKRKTINEESEESDKNYSSICDLLQLKF